jgi:outer membrane scaffolding protein for murein synthesis (MipA/OmpV family)
MRKFGVLVLGLMLIMTAAPVWASDIAGLGAGVAPDYEGSDDTKAVPMFMYNHIYDSGRFIKLMGPNLKFNLLADHQFSLGPVLNYRMSRNNNVDNNQVADLKNVDAAFEAGVFGGIELNNFLLGLEVLADVSGSHDGMTAQASAGYRWKAMPTLTLTPRIFTTYADSDYMDTYFTVDSGNIGSSSLPYYSADSGFKDVGIDLVAHYTPWEHWGIMGLLQYKSLLNDAKDSPLVDDVGDDQQFTFGLMGTYRWGK